MYNSSLIGITKNDQVVNLYTGVSKGQSKLEQELFSQLTSSPSIYRYIILSGGTIAQQSLIAGKRPEVSNLQDTKCHAIDYKAIKDIPAAIEGLKAASAAAKASILGLCAPAGEQLCRLRECTDTAVIDEQILNIQNDTEVDLDEAAKQITLLRTKKEMFGPRRVKLAQEGERYAVTSGIEINDTIMAVYVEKHHIKEAIIEAVAKLAIESGEKDCMSASSWARAIVFDVNSVAHVPAKYKELIALLDGCQTSDLDRIGRLCRNLKNTRSEHEVARSLHIMEQVGQG